MISWKVRVESASISSSSGQNKIGIDMTGVSEAKKRRASGRKSVAEQRNNITSIPMTIGLFSGVPGANMVCFWVEIALLSIRRSSN